jgi:hypothetical protein
MLGENPTMIDGLALASPACLAYIYFIFIAIKNYDVPWRVYEAAALCFASHSTMHISRYHRQWETPKACQNPGTLVL